ncbi:EF-hand domain-containing protein [Thiohalomonas denitrificans]|uniref:Sporulation protein YlmC, PRC-barrel domain family n=1 Tax=Thiohalomonas denitrificans TaxID=415747 RepID=A0A1G5Q1U5_9GAMM|nr:EF-hand domain-containing protein [Thiohalomonas denitrificans]SCZ55637.1 Sporulation protein YlmC, PRC-barrel domain family [Thiohalomonas denitrificans]
MEKKHLSLITGTIMGLSVAASGSTVAAQTDTKSASQPGVQAETVQYTVYDTPMESDPQAAGESPDSLMQLQVSELKGKSVASPDGTNLGEISDIVQSAEDQSLHAVVVVGGMLGVSQNRVTYPVEELQLRNGEIVTSTQMTEEELDQRTAYNPDDYGSVRDNQRLAEVSGESPSPGAEIASFQEIDQNGDGQISREEAQAHTSIVNAWQDVDVDSDNQINEAEFSAFEAGWEAAVPDIRQETDTGMDPGMGEEPGVTGDELRPEQAE